MNKLTPDNLSLSEPKNPQQMLLRERLREYVQEANAPNTRRAYKNDLAHFKAWGGMVPCQPQMVCDYLVTYAGQLAVSTLQRRLVAITRAHNVLSYANPVETEAVRLTIKGIQRKHGTAQRQVKPLVKEDILLMLAGMDDKLKATRDTALLLIGFCGAFRRSELVSLNVEDLEWVREGLIITLRHSKTDQTGQGRKIGIPYGRGSICPVKALQDWLIEAGITTGALFRPITRHGKLESTRLSDRAVATILKQRAEAVGIEAHNISGHSLRAGLATSAAQHGIPNHKIRAQTGHTSDAMLNRYIRDGELFTGNAAGLF